MGLFKLGVHITISVACWLPYVIAMWYSAIRSHDLCASKSIFFLKLVGWILLLSRSFFYPLALLIFESELGGFVFFHDVQQIIWPKMSTARAEASVNAKVSAAMEPICPEQCKY